MQDEMQPSFNQVFCKGHVRGGMTIYIRQLQEILHYCLYHGSYHYISGGIQPLWAGLQINEKNCFATRAATIS